MKFSDLPLNAPVQRAIDKVFKFEKLSAIQEFSLPLSMSGYDVFAKANTGSGKTLSFLIPIVNFLSMSPPSASSFPHVVIISPSRELAQQTEVECKRLLTYLPQFRSQLIIGGDSESKQKSNILKNRPQFLIATPGRLESILKTTKGLTLDHTRFFVLDECDRLLDSGFKPQIDKIIKYLPRDKQTFLFTATVPAGVREIADKLMRKDAKTVDVSVAMPISSIEQIAHVVPTSQVIPDLYDVLKKACIDPLHRVIVFFPSSRIVEFTAALFNENKVKVLPMIGDMKQGQRTKISQTFRGSPGHIMFATDVVARGVDFPDVTLVVQVGLTDATQYEHRIGRTARGGKSGKSLLILAEPEHNLIKEINQKLLKVEYPKVVLPNPFGKVNDSLRKIGNRAFQGQLGALQSSSKKLKMSGQEIVDYLSELFKSMGLSDPKPPSDATLKKMHLQGVTFH